MKITGTVVKLGIVSVVLLFFTVMIIVIFGQMRFDRTNGYTAEFSNVSGLRQGQFVRASGVEIGKVKALHPGWSSISIVRCRCISPRPPRSAIPT